MTPFLFWVVSLAHTPTRPPHMLIQPYIKQKIYLWQGGSLNCQRLARMFLYPIYLLSGLATTWCPPPSHHQMHESFVLRGFCALMLYSYGFCMTSRYRHETRPSVTSSELVYTLHTVVHITLYKIINKSYINREGWPRKRYREGL